MTQAAAAIIDRAPTPGGELFPALFEAPGSPLELAARRLKGATPEEVLCWAASRYAPRLAFATGFGPEGLVLLDLIARHRLPIDVFTLDTGLFFPETYALWRQLEDRYGMKIRAVRAAQSLEAQAARHGDRLWEREPDLCCAIRKLEPLAAALVPHEAWISAIRGDQTKDRAVAGVVERDLRYGLVKINPLLSWTSADVSAYLSEHQIPRNPLHDRGYPSIGCWPCTSAVRPGEDPRAGRWRGRAKTECGLHARVASAVSSLSLAEAKGA